MSREEKADLRKRTKENKLSMFLNFLIVPPKKNSQLDKEGEQLQKYARQLVREATTALQGLHAGTETGASTCHKMLQDVISTASMIGTEGTLKRLYVIQPNMAKTLRYDNSAQIISEEMTNDFRQARKNYRSNHTFNTDNGYSRYRFINNRSRPYYPSWKGDGPALSSVYNSGYAIGHNSNNSNNSFFLKGGRGNRAAASPEGLTSPTREVAFEAECVAPREAKGEIKGAGAPGAPLHQ
jgi:hypothetical protein